MSEPTRQRKDPLIQIGLDLAGIGKLGAPPLGGRSRRREICVIPPLYRGDVCGNERAHGADAFIRFACGCAFTYCKRSLVKIYGRVMLREGLCPRHGNSPQKILIANWLD